MAHRMPEGGRRLAGKRAPRAVGDRARDHQRQANAALGERLKAGEDRRLGVERVENGLDQDEVGAAVDEAADLLAVGDAQLVEGDRAEAGIVDVGRQRSGAVRRPQRAGDEAAPAVRLFRLDRRPPRQSRPVAIEFIDQVLHAVVGLRDRGRGEGVGLENVRARQRVGEMDVFDRLRLGQGQKIIVALQWRSQAMKTFAAEVASRRAQALDLGAHRSVDQQNPLARGAAQRRRCVLAAARRPCRKRDRENEAHSARRQCRSN